MIEFQPHRPKWDQVADVFRDGITDGTYPPGTRLPALLELQAEYGIALVTARKVYRALREEGLVMTTNGIGSFVRDDIDES